jgi:hypothetical protein
VVLNAVPPRSGIGREAAEGLERQGAQVAPSFSPSAPPSLTALSTDGRRKNSNRAGRRRRSTACACGYAAVWTCPHAHKPERPCPSASNVQVVLGEEALTLLFEKHRLNRIA